MGAGRGPVRPRRTDLLLPHPSRVSLEVETSGHGVGCPLDGQGGALFQEFHFITPQRTLNSPAARKVELGNDRLRSPRLITGCSSPCPSPTGQVAGSGDPPPRPQDECQQAGRGRPGWVRAQQGRERLPSGSASRVDSGTKRRIPLDPATSPCWESQGCFCTVI